MSRSDEPSPYEWDRWLAAIRSGSDPSEAAAELGRTASEFRRAAWGRPDLAEARAAAFLVRQDIVQRRYEERAKRAKVWRSLRRRIREREGGGA